MRHVTKYYRPGKNSNENEFIFPERLFPLDASLEIHTPRPLGITASVYIHEKARKMGSYHTRIYCLAEGEDTGGKTIPINSVGRWLFGVPGFQRHVRVVPMGSVVRIYYPETSPEIVSLFLHELKRTVEEEKER